VISAEGASARARSVAGSLVPLRACNAELKRFLLFLLDNLNDF